MQLNGTQIVNTSIPDVKLVESYIKANGTRAFTANQSFGGNKAIGLAVGTNTGDAVTFEQLQAFVNGATDVKQNAALAASTVNIAVMVGSQTVGGVVVPVGESVLLAGQTDATKNGLWTVNSGAWTRRSDADVSSEVTNGMFVVVSTGTGRGGYLLVTSNPITLDTTALTFVVS